MATAVVLGVVLGGCFATTGAPIDARHATRVGVLVLDLQVDFIGEAAPLPVARNQIEPMLAATNHVVLAADSSGVPVFYVANGFSSSDVIGNWFRNGAALKGTPGAALDPRLQVVGDRFDKDAPDAFSNPALDRALRDARVGHLVVIGVFADQCVYWTIRGALNRGYRVSVVPQAIAAASDDDLADAIAALRELGVEMVTLADVLARLES